MKFCSIASGSSGNCIYVGSSETSVLVDTGISGCRVEQGLNGLDLATKDMDAILLTHEHSDHVKGLGILARRYGIPIYATQGTADALKGMIVCARSGSRSAKRERTAASSIFQRRSARRSE